MSQLDRGLKSESHSYLDYRCFIYQSIQQEIQNNFRSLIDRFPQIHKSEPTKQPTFKIADFRSTFSFPFALNISRVQ